jgi:hypothetical protein
MHSSARIQTLNSIVDLCGETTIRILHPAQGWPALASVRLPEGESCLVALHVGSLGKSHRGRDDVERRFQNPGQGKPVQAPFGILPLLVGVWDEQGPPVLVGMDATRRLGDETRKSLFVPLQVLQTAQPDGWTEHVSASGERLIAFRSEEISRYAAFRLKGWTRMASRRAA